MEDVVMKSFGPPLIGRVSCKVPFFPFNVLEQAVTTYKFMREFRNELRQPVNVGTKLFPRRLIFGLHGGWTTCSAPHPTRLPLRAWGAIVAESRASTDQTEVGACFLARKDPSQRGNKSGAHGLL